MPFGNARVVLHDLREGGPTDGATLELDLSGDNHMGVFIPPGVAHGFAAITDTVITYLVDGYYNPADELGCFEIGVGATGVHRLVRLTLPEQSFVPTCPRAAARTHPEDVR